MSQTGNGGQPLSAGDIETLDFSRSAGLLPAVIQHSTTGAVLMIGYMNRAALRATFSTGRVVFFSRSRQCLWQKGETSGHFLALREIRTDCDRDALLVTAQPHGPVCHTGTATCFGGQAATKAESLAFLSALEEVIEQRVATSPRGSYTARLFSQGPRRIAQKVGEEGLEVALAAAGEADDQVIAESADLLFHLLVLLRSRGLPLASVVTELKSRHTSTG